MASPGVETTRAASVVDRERLVCGVIRRQEDLELVVHSVRQLLISNLDKGQVPPFAVPIAVIV